MQATICHDHYWCLVLLLYFFYCVFLYFFFFFQAEDGIRDVAVTGVQTCALPISIGADSRSGDSGPLSRGPSPGLPPPEPQWRETRVLWQIEHDVERGELAVELEIGRAHV